MKSPDWEVFHHIAPADMKLTDEQCMAKWERFQQELPAVVAECKRTGRDKTNAGIFDVADLLRRIKCEGVK